MTVVKLQWLPMLRGRMNTRCTNPFVKNHSRGNNCILQTLEDKSREPRLLLSNQERVCKHSYHHPKCKISLVTSLITKCSYSSSPKAFWSKIVQFLQLICESSWIITCTRCHDTIYCSDTWYRCLQASSVVSTTVKSSVTLYQMHLVRRQHIVHNGIEVSLMNSKIKLKAQEHYQTAANANSNQQTTLPLTLLSRDLTASLGWFCPQRLRMCKLTESSDERAWFITVPQLSNVAEGTLFLANVISSVLHSIQSRPHAIWCWNVFKTSSKMDTHVRQFCVHQSEQLPMIVVHIALFVSMLCLGFVGYLPATGTNSH